MSDTIQLVAIITPKPGKINEVIEKLAPFNKYVEADEQGVMQYELFRQVNGDAEVLVYLEVFKDMASIEAHRQTDEYNELMRTAAEDGLLMSPPDIKVLKHVSGFALRK